MRQGWKRWAWSSVLLVLTVLLSVGVYVYGIQLQPVSAEPVQTTLPTVEATTEETTQAPAETLAITSPTKNPCTVQDPFATITGFCAPQLPLTVNGQAVPVEPDGQFLYVCPLQVGENTVTVQNSKTEIVLQIRYERLLLRDVSPSKSVSAQGGMSVTVECYALAEAKVTASVGGAQTTLSRQGEAGADGFAFFSGTLQLPAATYEVQKLGKIRFTAVLGEEKQSISGGSVRIQAMEYPNIPIDSGQGNVQAPVISGDGQVQLLSPQTDHGRGTAKMLRVTADYAETCPASTADDKSHPDCTPFLRDTYDYITGSGQFGDKIYYITRSGYKVEQTEAESFDGYVLPTNTISVHRAFTDAETNVILTMNWRVPFVSALKGQSYRKGYQGRPFNVSASTASYIDFTFYYTNAVEGEIDCSGSPAIRRAEWVRVGENGTSTLRLHLRTNGDFYGYRAYYASDNRLVLSFRHAPKSSAAAVVVLDPGHGGRDPGAIGVNGMYESAVNLRIAALVKQNLEQKGVRVILTRTADVYSPLDARQALARQAGADAFVSIHCNSGTAPSVSGTEVYYYRAYAQPLAAAIHAQLASAWHGIYEGNPAMQNRVVPKDGGVRFYPFQVTRLEECPAVLVECGYLSNPTECKQLYLPAVQTRVAEAIAQGILQAVC